ncbi:MAG: MASE4 domain-containing protein [Pseudomonadota bacterium]
MSPSAAIAAAAAAPVPGVTRPAIKEDAGAREDDGLVFLSTAVPTRRDWRLASAVVIVSILVFIATAPFAAVPMLPVLAFIPAHEAALVVGDLVTAIMLFGQVGVVRSRALLALASGYLFTALIVIPHVLTLPGLFSATGLLGAGVQSTAWLYMAWHAGFPLAVMAYALLKRGDAEGDRLRAAPRVAIPCRHRRGARRGVRRDLADHGGESLLPAILAGNRKIGADIAVAVWMLSLIGLGVLLLRRPYAVLDLWLMVVLCAWLFDMALSAIVNTGASTSASMPGGSTGCWRRASCSASC